MHCCAEGFSAFHLLGMTGIVTMDLLDVMMKDVATEIPMTLIVVILSEEAQRIIVIGTEGETKCQQVCPSVCGWVGCGVVNLHCTLLGARDDVISFPQSDPGYSSNLAQNHWRMHCLREEEEEEEGEEVGEEGEGLLAPYLVKLNQWTQQQKKRKLKSGF